MGSSSSTGPKNFADAQPASRNQVVPVSEALQEAQEDAARLRQQMRAEKEEHAHSLEAAAAEDRKRLDEAAAAERLRLDAEAAVQRKRLDDAAAAERARLDNEGTAERKRLTAAATAEGDADRRRLNEEAAAERKRLDDESAALRQQLDEQAAEQRKRLDEEAAAVRQQLGEQAAEQRKRIDEEAAAARKRLDDDAAAERRRLDGVTEELQRQLQSLLAALTAAGPMVAALQESPRSLNSQKVAAAQLSVSRAAPGTASPPAAVVSVGVEEETAEAAAERQRREQEAAEAAAAEAERRRLLAVAAEAERRRLDELEAAAAAERRKVEEEVERTWTEKDLLACMPAEALQLEALPSSIRDLHDGMPAPLRAAPMRLLRISAVLAWPNIRVYEEIDVAAEALELPYNDVDAATWDATIILSWRWAAPKPAAHVGGFAPMSAEQFAELSAVLRRVAADGMSYIWIDWCCVPQYSAPSMVEVLRSKVFYARARAMAVIPTFVPIPSEGIVRLLLLKAARAVRARADAAAGDSPRSRLTLGVLESILSKERVAGREYFTRVWTLAERMARFGRPDQLRHWLSLEAWLGTLVDAMLRSTEDRSASAIYKRILGREAGRRLDAVLEPLAAAVKTGSMHVSEGLEEQVAELFELAVGIWHSKQELAEAPTKEWLVSYILDAHLGIYSAWSDADRVWAVYSYFCWKQLDQRSEAGLLEALQDLVRVAGGSRRLLMCMATKLGLAKALPPADVDRQLVAAAEAGNPAVMVGALEAGAFPDFPGTDGCAALHFASANGDLEGVRLLIKSGATVDWANVNGESALHTAAAKGKADVAAVLLAAGADKERTKAGGRTPLHVAVDAGHEAVVRLLLDRGANKEARDGDGRTPLYLGALTNGKSDVIRVLLEAGSNKDFRNANGLTALHAAAIRGHEDTVRLLMHAGMDPNAVTNGENKLTPLHYAAEKGHAGAIRALAQNGAKLDASGALGTPLHRACVFGNTAAAEALLAAGARKEAREPSDSKTPLMVAAHNGQVDTLKALLAARADVSARDKDGWEPIHFAAKADSYECCKLLKAAGASTKNKTKAGNYPSDLAKDSRVKHILPDGRGLIEGVGAGLFKALF